MPLVQDIYLCITCAHLLLHANAVMDLVGQTEQVTSKANCCTVFIIFVKFHPLQEFLKSTVDVADLFGLYLTMSKFLEKES